MRTSRDSANNLAGLRGRPRHEVQGNKIEFASARLKEVNEIVRDLPETLSFGSLSIIYAESKKNAVPYGVLTTNYQADKQPHPLRLSKNETELMLLFMAKGDAMYSLEEIAEWMSVRSGTEEKEINGFKSDISRLQKLLRSYPAFGYEVVTYHGRGYRLEKRT